MLRRSLAVGPYDKQVAEIDSALKGRNRIQLKVALNPSGSAAALGYAGYTLKPECARASSFGGFEKRDFSTGKSTACKKIVESDAAGGQPCRRFDLVIAQKIKAVCLGEIAAEIFDRMGRIFPHRAFRQSNTLSGEARFTRLFSRSRFGSRFKIDENSNHQNFLKSPTTIPLIWTSPGSNQSDFIFELAGRNSILVRVSLSSVLRAEPRGW